MLPAFGRRKANSPDAVQESNEIVDVEAILPSQKNNEIVDPEGNQHEVNQANQNEHNDNPFDDETSFDHLFAGIESPRFEDLENNEDQHEKDEPEKLNDVSVKESSSLVADSSSRPKISKPRHSSPRKSSCVASLNLTNGGISKPSRVNSGPLSSVLTNHLPSREEEERDAEWDFKKKHMLVEQAARRSEVLFNNKLSDAITKSLNPGIDQHTQSLQELQIKREPLNYIQAELDYKERNLEQTKELKRRREQLESDKMAKERESQKKKSKIEDISM